MSKEWTCPVCGSIYERDTAPSKCSMCGLPGTNFSMSEVSNDITRVKCPHCKSINCEPNSCGFVRGVFGVAAGIAVGLINQHLGHGTMHAITHTEEGEYKCNTCGQTFKYKI